MAENQRNEVDDELDLGVFTEETRRSIREKTLTKKEKRKAALKEYGLIIFYALLIAFVLKTFVIRGFYIPSGSMENTLKINDRVFVNVAGNMFSKSERGDVIVFKDSNGWMQQTAAQASPNPVKSALSFIGILPDTSQNYLVKRVIGVGGDHVVYDPQVGKVTINGEEIEETYLYPGDIPSQIPFDVIVPENSYFVMGDHRSNSADSRYHIEQGAEFISDSDVVGKVFVVAFPFSNFNFVDDESKVFEHVPENG